MKLDPNRRGVLAEILVPPPGFAFDEAIVTTFTLELPTLLTVPIHLALAAAGTRETLLANPVALLDGVRRVRDKLTVYCDHGHIRAPRDEHVLFSLLEPVLVPVKAPRGGVFHPKLWLVRYVPDGGGAPMLRLVVLSRNLTSDRSWDVVLQLDGRVGSRRVPECTNLRALVDRLPRFASAGRAAPAHHERAHRLALEVGRTTFERPPHVRELAFFVFGLDRKSRFPHRGRNTDELVVFSPFVTDDALLALAGRSHAHKTVVSELPALQALKPSTFEHFDAWYSLRDEAASDDGEEAEDEELRGLHAKLYVARIGWDLRIWMGSANATRAGLHAPTNVELLVELTGRHSRLGVPDDLLAEGTGMGALLEKYEPHTEPPTSTPPEPAPQAGAAAALIAAADAGALVVACSPSASQRTWRQRLEPTRPIAIPDDVQVSAWPVSLPPRTKVDAASLRQGEPVPLAGQALSSLTGLVAFEVTSGDKIQNFVLNLPVRGRPEEHDAAILRDLLRDGTGFLRYLRYLLGVLDSDVASADIDRLRRRSSGEGPDVLSRLLEDEAVLETIVRCLARAPERLREVGRVVDALRDSPDEDVIPPDFLELWDVFAPLV